MVDDKAAQRCLRAAYCSIEKFDDFPEYYKRNVNGTETPYIRHPGMPPDLSIAKLEDVIAFPGILTDGYDAPK